MHCGLGNYLQAKLGRWSGGVEYEMDEHCSPGKMVMASEDGPKQALVRVHVSCSKGSKAALPSGDPYDRG